MSHLFFCSFQENTRCTDAYVVTFSVHDHASYQIALGYLQYLRQELDSDRPIILVANKVDLVRKRQISKNGTCQSYPQCLLIPDKYELNTYFKNSETFVLNFRKIIPDTFLQRSYYLNIIKSIVKAEPNAES